MNSKRFAIVVLLVALTSLCLAAINLNNSLNLLDKKDWSEFAKKLLKSLHRDLSSFLFALQSFKKTISRFFYQSGFLDKKYIISAITYPSQRNSTILAKNPLPEEERLWHAGEGWIHNKTYDYDRYGQCLVQKNADVRK